MVSIIIPVYNVAPYVEDCLKSVIRQTYDGKIECIIVDDCSTNNSAAVIDCVICSYHGPIQFQILHHGYNRGLSAARNTGTIEAKGDYLYYLDGDDEITEDCIEKLMAVVSQDMSTEMVQGNAITYHGRQQRLFTRKFPIKHVRSNADVRTCFYYKHLIPVTAWNKLIKRTFLQQTQLLFKEGLLWEDAYWLFFLLKHLKNVGFVSFVTYLHKNRPDSIVNSTDKKLYAKHRAIYFHDVLMNLTPFSEQMEMKYVVRKFAFPYLRFVGELPEYKELFSMFWNKAKEYKSYSLNLILAVCYVLGMIKYGWVVIPILKRLRHLNPFCVIVK